MAPSVQLRPEPRRCPQCSADLDLKSPHVEINGSAIRVFCSEACRSLAAAGPLPPPPLVIPPPRSGPSIGWHAGLVTLVVGLLVLGRGESALVPAELGATVSAIETASNPPEPVAVEPDPAAIAAAAAEAERARWTESLSTDRWVHPLAGPKRRMPIRLSRVFGAERPGHRPIECNAGHCGVDLGGEVWGEPILAAHDGLVDRVQRDPDRGRGGMYVRLAHRDGTVFTQYFHLAAIPRELTAGDEVEAGEVIGLLGTTGIKHSAPHLHFTVSVRSSGEGPEQFIDPEPLVALWPVAIPVFGDVASIARTHTIPGHPRGPYGRRKRKKRAAETAVEVTPPAPEATAQAEPPAAPGPSAPGVRK
jgi:hypothetical protein